MTTREPTNGVVIGQVTNNTDPLKQGRIEVYFPWLGESSPRRWCSVASLMAGDDYGLFFMPEDGDEVLVAFDHGDFDHGYIVGYMWNPVNKPPSDNPNKRVIQSREKHKIIFLDATNTNGGDKGALIVEDGHGNTVTMTNGVMTVKSMGHMRIEATTMTIMGRPVNPMGGAI